MAEDCNIDLAKDALTKGASFFIQKPLVPSDLARLWFHILWLTEALPAATSSKQKKRTLINSEEGNGKQRKSQTTQGPSHLQVLIQSLPTFVYFWRISSTSVDARYYIFVTCII